MFRAALPTVTTLMLLCLVSVNAAGQCGAPVNAFPYNEDFEASDGGWMRGGAGVDWAWGSPAKSVINSAGGGINCWIVGGLTGNSYTDGQASYLQSPCFDFTNLQYPYIEFKVFWEMEQQFDGGGLQYSLDNGVTWMNVGSANDARNCLNENWFNHSAVTYLAPLAAVRHGWSGNIQPTAGSCQGGNGSNGWVVARHTMPYLAGEPNVIFRFVFGAGTICNNYNGFAVDDIQIGEAPPNQASFSYACGNNNVVVFTNTSILCPTTFSWNFGDPASGSNNSSNEANPTHIFSSPGTYTVTLTVTGPGNAPSTTSAAITILGLSAMVVLPADCISGTGGSAVATVSGSAPGISYSWNSIPPQATSSATNLRAQTYTVTVNAPGACPAMAEVIIPLDFSCIGIYFPKAFTPNGDGLNDFFGPLGSLAALSDYKLSIYNRWGERIFYSNDPGRKWNGEVRGGRADSNVFIWFAEFTLQGQPREIRKGTVTLIR